jgi:hypothetical protein
VQSGRAVERQEAGKAWNPEIQMSKEISKGKIPKVESLAFYLF